MALATAARPRDTRRARRADRRRGGDPAGAHAPLARAARRRRRPTSPAASRRRGRTPRRARSSSTAAADRGCGTSTATSTSTSTPASARWSPATPTRPSSPRSASAWRAGTHFAQPVPDIIPVAEELARRFGLPLWRFANSGTEATLAAVHLMRAVTGRPPADQGRGQLPRPPRRASRCRCTPSRPRPAPPAGRARCPSTRRCRRSSPPSPTSSRSAASTPSAVSSSTTPERSPG